MTHEWNFWLFPTQITFSPNTVAYQTENETLWNDLRTSLKTVSSVEADAGMENRILVSEVLNEDIISYVASGGRLLLINLKEIPRYVYKTGWGGYYFTKPAHYPPYEDGNCGTIIRNHKMLNDFPHEGFADLQFYQMIEGIPPFDMTLFSPYGVVPVIQAFGSPYAVSPQRAYLFESAVGKGWVIFCSLKVDPKNVASVYLLSVLSKYAASSSFCPKEEIPLDILRSFSKSKSQ